MSEVLGVRGIGDIDNRSSVGLHGARQWIYGRPGVVAHKSDLTSTLVDDDGLVRRAALEIAMANQFHVPLRLLVRRVGRRLLSRRASRQGHRRDSRSIRRVGLREKKYGRGGEQTEQK